MTVAEPTIVRYHANAALSGMDEGTLSQTLSERTSTLQSDKKSLTEFRPFLQRAEEKQSYLAFCGDILSYEVDDDEYPISDDALKLALHTAERAFIQLRNKWRTPRIATDGGVGLRLTWRLGNKEIRAVFPADRARAQYLYVEQGEVHELIRNFTSTTLCAKLEWLLSN